MIETDFEQPTASARRQAVAAALGQAPSLIRFAGRFSHCLDDAEDAYQRAMEIALTSAPSVEHPRFMAWLHMVIRNEALRIARTRRLEEPWDDEDLAMRVGGSRTAAQPLGPEAIAEWRERYRALQDALAGLTEQQRVCLTLLSAGVSRSEIGSITGYSERQIVRSIREGRSELRAFEVRLASGEECAVVAPLMDAVVDGSASRRERSRLTRHVRHCGACRVAYRSRRDQFRLMSTLVPSALIGTELIQSRPVDPTFAWTWWERVTGSATVRTGQAVQLMYELPALAGTKAGIGTLAAVFAGAVGAPIVVEAVRAPASDTAARPIVAAPATTLPRPEPAAARPVRPATRPATTAPATSRRPTPARTTTYRARTTSRTTRPRVAVRSGTPARRSTATSLEFGP